MNKAPYFLYYTRNLPARSVPIAYLSTPAATPEQLTSINNIIYAPMQGSLTLQQHLGTTTFTAPAINIPVIISGSTTYIVGNQFIEITDRVNGETPLFYCHLLPVGVSSVTVLNTDNKQESAFVIQQINRDGVTNYYLLHNFDAAPRMLRYVDTSGIVQLQLLQHTPVIRWSPVAATSTTYTLVGSVLNLETTGAYYVRFTSNNGYSLITPYDDLPNVPWYVRVRFGLLPVATEWAQQHWLPFQPYTLGIWITGKVSASNLISFERAPIYFDGTHYPSVIVYDSKYKLKYALSGDSVLGGNSNSPTEPEFGYDLPWRLGQFVNIDPQTGVVQVSVALDPTDIVFGFYSYKEPDVVYRGLDINPATNPAVRNQEIQFYYDNSDPSRTIYHNIPPATLYGGQQLIGYIVVGTAISTSRYSINDERNRGGGLAPSFQNIPQAMDFWDLGYWNGKPFPIGGTIVVYLPTSVQDTYTTDQLQAKIQSILPMGVLPIIRYYDKEGNEGA